MTTVILVVDRDVTPRQLSMLSGASAVEPRSIRIEHTGSLCEVTAAAILEIENAGLRPMRVQSRDWMTLEAIAIRLGRSREIVRRWSTGETGPGGFPPPLNPGSATNFFSWHEASKWVQRYTRYSVEDIGNPLLIAMNHALQLRRLASQFTRRDLDTLVAQIVTETSEPTSNHKARGIHEPRPCPSHGTSATRPCRTGPWRADTPHPDLDSTGSVRR